MKKSFTVLLTAIMLLLSACGQATDPDSSFSPPEPEQVSAPAPTKSDAPVQSAPTEDVESSEQFDPNATIEV